MKAIIAKVNIRFFQLTPARLADGLELGSVLYAPLF